VLAGPVAVGQTYMLGAPLAEQGDTVAASTPFTAGQLYTVTAVYPVSAPRAGQNSASTGGRNSAGVHDGSDGGPLDVVVLSPAPNGPLAANFGYPAGSIPTDLFKYLRRLS